MNKIKVLYISHSSEIAGAEVCLLTLLKYIDKNSFEPVVIFPSEGPLMGRIQSLGIKTYVSNLDWWVRGSDDFRSIAESTLSDRVQCIVDIIDAEAPDIVYTNTSVVWEGALAASLKGIPHIWHVHEKLEGHPGLKPVVPLPLVYLTMDLLSDRVVVVSNSVKEQLSSVITSGKLLTIFNGIDDENFMSIDESSLRDELDLPDDVRLAVTIGSIVKEKGHDTLLEAASLIKKYGGKINFLIAGGGTPEAVNELLKKIENMGLNDSVYYLGFRNDVPRIIQSADFLVLPSLTEAFPLVVLEAMAAGKPVLATDCGGPAEMVVDGESGFIVPVNDPESLCEKILHLSSDNKKIIEMGKMALNRFNNNYRADIFAGHFECLFNDIINNNESTKLSKKGELLLDGLLQAYQNIVEVRHEKDQLLAEKDQQLAEILSSRSWKLTKPLRKLKHLLARKKLGQKIL